ncbi:MFS transporter [Salmonella enterica]|nr:MFS transporter [Salmonella enterica]EBE4178834.1 MFS transporter [Salmonella enterica]ECF5413356.1 MFS transporter [Salmonella enterica]ECJ1088943.1 MFS transporter [Salmonella enterica]ECJ9946861.1 MFS transporter [Salmonella enterica]
MTKNLTPSRSHHALWASMAALYLNGLMYAVWGVNIVVIRTRFDLSEGALSLALAAVAVGGIATMAMASRIVTRKGSRYTAMVSGLLMGGSASLILVIPQFIPLLALLFVFGIFVAAHDISVNTQVASLERLSGKPMIGALHGSFSAGGLSGALLSSYWQGASLPAEANFLVPAVIGTAIILFTWHFMIPREAESISTSVNGASAAAVTGQCHKGVRSRLQLLGLLAFSALVVEGAFYDWAAVYMRDVVKAPRAWVGYGYAAFAVGLVSGRLSGDLIRARIAHQLLIAVGWIVAAGGLAAVLALRSPAEVVAGFFFTGLGIANIIPLLFSTAARLAVQGGMPASEGLAITTRIGYIGLLAGPLIVGPIAEFIGLRLSLLSLGLSLTFTCAGWLTLSHRTGGKPWRI